jgi:tape measure domain-containing protein
MISVDNRDALAGLEQTRRAASATGEAIGKIFALAGVSFGAAALVAYAKQVSDVGVAAESAEVRLKSLAGRFGEADQAQRAAADAAELLNLSQTEAASGFAQLYSSLRPTGVGLQQIETIFVGVTAAAKNTGLSAESVNNALIQLTQGLASGRLQGDELRSVLEQLPPLSQAIAKELKVPVGALKQLGSEGKISTEIIIKALESLKGQEVGQLSKALGTSQEKLKTLSVEAQNFQKELSTAFGAPALATVGALTNAFKGLAGAIRAANIANQNKELTLQADQKAGNLVQAAIGPFGGSGFFGDVSITYKGKTYKGTATGVKNDIAKAILTDLINELSSPSGGTGGSPTPTPTATVDPKIKSAVEASQKRLDNLTRIQGLEGSVLEIYKAQLSVQDNITERQRLQAEYDKAVTTARGLGKDPNKEQSVIDASARLATATTNLRSAFIEGSQSAATALISAADRFKSAGDSLRSSLEGAFKFLTPQIQKQLTDNAKKDIQAAQKAGIFRGDVVGFNTTPEELLSIGGSARGVLAAAKNFDTAGKDLVSALDAVQSPLISLAEKDWRVVVNLASDGYASVSGDVLGGVA